MSGTGGARGGFLIGYGPQAAHGQIKVSMGGQLGRGGAQQLDACRAHVKALPVSRICIDLSALAVADESGARDLFALCRRLRLDGFQVDVLGMQAQVRTVLRKLGLSLGTAGLCVPDSRRRRAPDSRDGLPRDPEDAA